MRRVKDPSRFLDLFAGDDEEDEEEDEDEDEDGDGIGVGKDGGVEDDDDDADEEGEGDGEDLDGVDLEGDSGYGSFRFEGEEELDAALDALRERAVERAGRASHSAAAHYSNIDATRLLTDQSNVPTYADSAIFSVQVKKGKEQVVLFRLIRKWVAALDINPLLGIRSVFTVPHMTGRIYVEALAPTAVERLCKGMVFLYMSSIFVVPICDRVTLLSPSVSSPPHRRGEFVKIRNGLYAGDIGEVVNLAEDSKNLVVKLKSREQVPTGKKRKRGGTGRRNPCVFGVDLLRQQFCENEETGTSTFCSRFKDLGTNGFLLDGRRYTADGYLLLEIRSDRVVRDIRNEDTFRTVVDRESQRAMDWNMNSDSSDSLFTDPVCLPGEIVPSALPDRNLKPGEAVQICSGPSAGATGFLFSVSSKSCVVEIPPPEAEPCPSVFFECDIASVKRTFEVGERVEVMLGELKGRTGIVFSVDGDNLNVVDTRNVTEFKVPRDFVATILRTTFSNPSDLVKAKDIADAVSRLRFGWFVRILRGKHAGKTGRVVYTNPNRVWIVEDVTKIQLVARNDNVEVHGDVPDPVPFKEPTAEQLEAWKSCPTPRPDVKVQGDPDKCLIDHFAVGFEGQEVYAWRGPLKGKIGTVVQVSGTSARLSVDSAMQGKSIVDVPLGSLVAKCACALAPGVDLQWSKDEKLKLRGYFKRLPRRGNTPPPHLRSSGISHQIEPEPLIAFHDPSGEGMWLFHEGVSRHRMKYNLVVKIESHREAAISGLREGLVLADPHPLVNPIRLCVPTTVLVRVPDRRSQTRVEPLHVGSLRTTSKVKDKGLHVIVKGEKAGMLVLHLKSDGRMARVFETGKHRSTAFYIEKENLCVAE